MKKFSLIFLGAFVLLMALVLPGYVYVGQADAAQGPADLSVNAAPDQAASIQAVQADYDGQTVIASKGDDDDDEHDDKNDDRDDDENDDHDKTPEPTHTPEATETPEHHDDDHDTPEPTHTPGHDDDHGTPEPTHTPGPGRYQEFRGRIEAMNGNVWIIAGRTVMVTSRTRLEAERAPMAVGAWVEVKASPQTDGSYLAAKIETKHQAQSSSSAVNGDQSEMSNPSQPDTQQRQALQAVSSLLQWLMETFNLDFSQMMSLLQTDQ